MMEQAVSEKQPVVRKLKLASTIGPVESGIVAALAQAFTRRTGVAIEYTGAGTGQAMRMAETGEFDLVLAHAPVLEEEFVAAGMGTDRFAVMYNDFVVVGPEADPAGIRGARNAAAAFARIARAQAQFVTRGDGSGTHIKELEVWRKAGLECPQGAWYLVFKDGAKGSAATLAYSDKERAYTMADRATYMALKPELSLRVMAEKDEILLNHMTMIPVNPGRFPQVWHAEAMHFVQWLQGDEARGIIRGFGREEYGEPLFFPTPVEGQPA